MTQIFTFIGMAAVAIMALLGLVVAGFFLWDFFAGWAERRKYNKKYDLGFVPFILFMFILGWISRFWDEDSHK